MDKKEILKIANDPRYIEGIYNYCDRWCERCPFTSRCLNYAIAGESFRDLTMQDLRNKAFWDTLLSMLQQTFEMITEWAEEQGIDLDALDLESAAEEERQRRSEAESHELAQAARKYSYFVDQWFEAEQSLFEQRREDLQTLIELGVSDSEPYDEADSIHDAIEVIRWYQHQIYVKFMRALMQDDALEEIEEGEQRDSDGSIKVALIGMDRSIATWGKLRTYFPEKGDEILDILLHLDRLRRRTEQVFPHARSFIRPGFDTEVPEPPS